MNKDLLPPPNSGITPEEWQQTPERVCVWIKGMWEEVKQLKARWRNSP